MRRDITASIIAMLAMTLILGIAYPLAVTGIAQIAFHDRANGSRITRSGDVVGSRLLAQAFDQPAVDDAGKRVVDDAGNELREPDPRYFQPRPSQTSYDAAASGFLNQGPNQRELADLYVERVNAYRELERVDGAVPIDAVTNSGSGLDPHVSIANARIQAARVAKERGVRRATILELVEANTHGRWLGVFGAPGVNVLELNLDLDEELDQR